MERKLYEAAVEGSVISLLNLLQGDALLLDRFITGCYPETPLHRASTLGHAEFVEEIVTRKPELAEELDLRISSPLHLATAKGQINIVKRLLQVNADMCLVCDRDGRNPLHIAAIKGQVNVLRVLVQARPNAARMLIDGDETILHACVRYNQLEAMKYLLVTIANHELVNFRNSEDNTILHVAVADKQIEVVNFLIATNTVDVNSLNADDFTPIDLLLEDERNLKLKAIARSLQCVGALRSKDTSLSKHKLRDVRTKILSPPTCYQMNASYSKYKVQKNINCTRCDDWLERKRSALMVVASLLATMAFQAGVNPPGGIWQDNFEGDSKSKPHKAGSWIMADTHPIQYKYFLIYNSGGFMASLSIILLLLSGLPLKRRFVVWIFMAIVWVALYAMTMSYLISVFCSTPFRDFHVPLEVANGSLSIWIGLVSLLLLAHTIRSIIKMIRYLRKLMRKRETNHC
ncbi:hypothetical protein REPUB_Repub18cG0071500 [Reevesia pubescens]